MSTPTAPASGYVGAERFERERQAIWAAEWVAIGDAARLAQPGSYLAVVVAGFPVVVVNDAGVLRGFHNVCRHRAGPLCADGEGSCRSFVCRYHGWAYALDGTLKSARDFGEEPERDALSLHAISVDRWRGLLFINMAADPVPLLDWLGVIPAHAERFDMAAFEVTHRSSHPIEANWKVYAENYQEGYHIPLVHPGLNKQIESSRYEVLVDGAVTMHSAPTRDGSVTDGSWLWRFPGLALNLYPSGMCLESYWPTSPTSTMVEYTFFFSPDTPAAEAQASVDSSVAILEEDRVICEAVQRNLGAGIYDAGILSPRYEAGVALVQTLVAEALAR